MRLHRFYVPQEIGKQDSVVIKNPDLFHQLKNVFRFTTGGQVILFDGTGYEYHALIVSFDRGEVSLSVVSRKESKNIPSRELHLYASVIKKDNFEWIIEKGTELGVTRFIPLLSDRSEKKALNTERIEKIMLEASEQSGRSILPTIAPVTPFEETLDVTFPCFAFHPTGEVFTINHTQNHSPLGIFIGPEGGWTEREVFLFKKRKIKVHSLGSQILRAETAAIAISSLILLQ
jgi:16S rRNA (uracil1498-N3)-methyltransferase